MDVRFRSDFITLSGTTADVRGLEGLCLPFPAIVMLPAPPSYSSCKPKFVGSATSSTTTLSKPEVARASNAVTFEFLGNVEAHSRAEPAKITVRSVMQSKSKSSGAGSFVEGSNLAPLVNG